MADALTSAPAAASPKLDDLMLAMDVVDTLRHDQRLVERELSLGYSDEALIQRLREIYKSQGIEVPDRVLEEGVKALREKRFSYEPSKPGFARNLALLWINRARVGQIALGVFTAVAIAAALYHLAVVRPREIAEANARQEISDVLPKALESGNAEVSRVAKVDPARTYAAQLVSDGRAALARGDVAAARKANADLTALLNDLRLEFDLRIVNRPGEASGVWRKPMINPQGRNYYLIVEAIAPDGRALQRPILNEETGVTSVVQKWGIRMNNDVFQQVLADKRDDGIIQRNLVGKKKPGYLDVDYVTPVLGGTITKW
jgi:hypothetical protein